jgi:hypothetical protein
MNVWLWIKAHPWVSALVAASTVALTAKPAAAKAKEVIAGGGGAPGDKPDHVKGFGQVRAYCRMVCKAAGMSNDATSWAENFMVLQAASESGANNYRGLGIPSRFPSWAIPTGGEKNSSGQWEVEAGASSKLIKIQNAESNAARISYDRNRDRGTIPPGGASVTEWTIGSGGWFGLLPASGLYAFRKSKENGEFLPFDIFDARRSVVMLLAYMQRLTAWSTFKAQPADEAVAVMKRGMASPDLMNKPGHSRSISTEAKARANAKKWGVPASFFSRPIPAELKMSRDWLKLIRKVEGR